MDPLSQGAFGRDDEEEDIETVDPVDELIATFQGVVSQGRRKMNIIPHVATGELKENVRQLADLYASARELMEKIEEEAQEMPNSSHYSRTIRLCAKDFERFEEQYNRIMSREDLKRHTLGADGDRQRLLIEGELMCGNTSAIEAASRRLNETTETGTSVLGDLKGQSEQLRRTVDKVMETNEVLKKSKRILDGMARSAATNKLTTALIILLEVFLICVIIYYKFAS
mmetsp:Transcript_11869/g.16598  ORF Transcript_11869/g.16598 Transcript_11869/m.16598 type:complete len:227 (+) Transcript_11869:29-709(+)